MAVTVAIVTSTNGFIGAASSTDALRTQANPGPGFVGRTLPPDKRLPRPLSLIPATVDAGRRLAWRPQGLRRIRICAT